MLIKEIKDTLIHTGFMLGVFALFLLGLYISFSITGDDFDISAYFQFFYQLFIFLFSFFMGISLFSSEIRNNGFEYLLTLPYTRSKLLLTKIFPRFIMLIILYLGYMVIFALSTTKPFLITPELFNSLYFSLFFISTSLSVLRGNFVANSLVTMMLFLVCIVSANLIAWLVAVKYFGKNLGFKLSAFTVEGIYPFNPDIVPVMAGLLSIPFIISLFYGFRKYDIRSSKRYLKRFITLFIPLFLVGMVLSYFLLDGSVEKSYYFDYYLTENGKLIKRSYSKMFIYNGEKKVRVKGFGSGYLNLYEDDNYLYSIDRESEKSGSQNILRRMDKDNLKVDIIYAPQKGMNLRRPINGFRDRIVVVEVPVHRDFSKRDDWNVIFIDTTTLENKKVIFPYNALWFFGVDGADDNLRWLGYLIREGGVVVYSINEKGDYRKVMWSEKYPVFANGKLVTYLNGHVVIGKLTEEGYVEIKRIKIDKKYIFPGFRGIFSPDLDNSNTRFIYGTNKYGWTDRSFIKLDLETYEIKILKFDFARRGWLKAAGTRDYFMISLDESDDRNVNGVFRFEGDNLVPVKILGGEKYKYWKELTFLRNGIMIREKKEIRLYTFPDFKELKY